MIVQIDAHQADICVTFRCGGSYNPSVMDDLRRHAVGTFQEVWAGLPDSPDGEPIVVDEVLDQPAQPPEE